MKALDEDLRSLEREAADDGFRGEAMRRLVRGWIRTHGDVGAVTQAERLIREQEGAVEAAYGLTGEPDVARKRAVTLAKFLGEGAGERALDLIFAADYVDPTDPNALGDWQPALHLFREVEARIRGVGRAVDAWSPSTWHPLVRVSDDPCGGGIWWVPRSNTYLVTARRGTGVIIATGGPLQENQVASITSGVLELWPWRDAAETTRLLYAAERAVRNMCSRSPRSTRLACASALARFHDPSSPVVDRFDHRRLVVPEGSQADVFDPKYGSPHVVLIAPRRYGLRAEAERLLRVEGVDPDARPDWGDLWS